MSGLQAIRRALRPVKRFYRAQVPRVLRPFMFSKAGVVNGKRFCIPLIAGVGLYNQVGTEPWMLDLLKRLLRVSGSSGLIDVGVNTGQTLLKFRSIAPALRYVGFEPNPFCVWYAYELIRLNRFEGCEIFPVALSDAPGLVGFIAENEADSAASMVAELRPDRQSFRKQYIATLVFDELQLDVDGISLVKIDVEGAELHVLLGMQSFLQRSRPFIVCEVLHAHSRATLGDMRKRNDAIVGLLMELRYSIFRLIKGSAEIAQLQAMSRFPDEVWNASSWELCDYLFVPVEQTDRVLSAFERSEAPAPAYDRSANAGALASLADSSGLIPTSGQAMASVPSFQRKDRSARGS